MNRKNLEILRDNIMMVPQELFNMATYRGEPDDEIHDYSEFKSKSDCGTLGCALGWCPFIEGLDVKTGDFNKEGLSFYLYGDRLFGFEKNDRLFDWIFDMGWKQVDNTPLGVSLRIQYLFDHNMKVPNYDDPETHHYQYLIEQHEG